MRTVTIPSDQVRVPEITAGVATAVRRYDRERAYVLHPEDYRRLVALEELASAAMRLGDLELSDAAITAHREESTPGETIADPDALRALLGV